jgi:hypothetical protein
MHFKEGQQFENPNPGNYIARCYAVIDLGTQQHSYQGEAWSSRDVRISFELPMEKMTGIYNPENKGRPFSVHLTVKQSLHAKSKLRPMLEGWRGRKFTKDELAGFDARNILDKPCRLTLVQNGDYVNIASISPLAKGDKCPKLTNPSVFFSLEEKEFDEKIFAELHEKTREKIAGSPEYSALTGASNDVPDDTGHGGHEPHENPSDRDDDIPF